MIGVTNPREDRKIAQQDPASLEIWASDCQMIRPRKMKVDTSRRNDGGASGCRPGRAASLYSRDGRRVGRLSKETVQESGKSWP